MDVADSAPSPVLAQHECRQAGVDLEHQIDTAIRCMRAAKTPSLQRHYEARLRELMAFRPVHA